MLVFQILTNTVTLFVLSLDLLKRIRHQLREMIMLLLTKTVQSVFPIMATVISTIRSLVLVRVMLWTLVTIPMLITTLTEMLYESLLFAQALQKVLDREVLSILILTAP